MSGIKGGLLSATPGDLLDESLEIITLRGEFVSCPPSQTIALRPSHRLGTLGPSPWEILRYYLRV